MFLIFQVLFLVVVGEDLKWQFLVFLGLMIDCKMREVDLIAQVNRSIPMFQS